MSTGLMTTDEARARFIDFFSELSEERVRSKIRDTYNDESTSTIRSKR